LDVSDPREQSSCKSFLVELKVAFRFGISYVLYCDLKLIVIFEGMDTIECKLMPDMLACPKLTVGEKDILLRFHNNAKIRIQQIFNSQPHLDNLLHTIRGLQQDISILVGTISSIRNLFQDTLDDTPTGVTIFILKKNSMFPILIIFILNNFRSKKRIGRNKRH
jgi:hypothetical protein